MKKYKKLLVSLALVQLLSSSIHAYADNPIVFKNSNILEESDGVIIYKR